MDDKTANVPPKNNFHYFLQEEGLHDEVRRIAGRRKSILKAKDWVLCNCEFKKKDKERED